MAVAHVQAAEHTTAGSGNSEAITWGSNTTSGNAIALYISWGDTTAAISSIVDSQSNTYTLIDHDSDSFGQTSTYYAKNITGGTTPTVTVNFNNTFNSRFLLCHEFSGADVSAPLDQHLLPNLGIFTDTTTDACTTGNVTTTTNGQYIFGAVSYRGFSATFNAGTGYTGTGTTNDRGEYQVQSSAGAIAATFTLTGGNTFAVPAIVTFKAASVSTDSEEWRATLPTAQGPRINQISY